MVVSLLTTLGRVTPHPFLAVLAGLVVLAGQTVCTERTHGRVREKAPAISKAVITAAVAVAQEPHGQTHRATVVEAASELSGVHQDHVRIPRTPRKELTRCRNIIYL